MVIILIAVVAIVAVYFILRAEKRKFEQGKEVYKLKKVYQESLIALKHKPGDANLKIEALKLGRELANLTRSSSGVTIYDEVALMNDINSASGGTTEFSARAADANKTVEKRLASLSDLKDKALIDDQEYETQRQKIINEI